MDDSSDYAQAQANLELHERTMLALVHAKFGLLTADDFKLLCWHAGIDYEKDIGPIENGHFYPEIPAC